MSCESLTPSSERKFLYEISPLFHRVKVQVVFEFQEVIIRSLTRDLILMNTSLGVANDLHTETFSTKVEKV